MRMMKRSVLSVMVALASIGCAAEVGSTSEGLTDGLGGVCTPSWQTPLRLTPAGADVGGTTIESDASAVRVAVEAAPGWELGDVYVGVGPDAGSLVWTAVNPEPWITGWHPSLDVEVALADAGLSCAQDFKVIVQAYVRPVGTTERQLASALGSGSLGEWGWYEIGSVCCPPAENGCTYTQGYWKNHPEAWPVGALTLGGESYDAAELAALLDRPVRRDASVSLAHQLIAAELNVAGGASPDPAIAEAHAWLAAQGGRLPMSVHASTAAGAEATSLVDRLAAYNEGVTGPGHCDG